MSQEVREHVDIAIVTVSANKLDESCLISVKKMLDNTSLNVRFVLVDNASTKFDAHSYVKKHIPESIVILRDKNVGFGASCNRGVQEVEADYYFFLNPDTRIDQLDLLSQLRTFLSQHPNVGIVAPKVLYMDGKIQETCRRFPAWYTPIVQRTHLFDNEKTHKHKQEFLMHDFHHDKKRLVDWVQGSAFMIRGEIFKKIGGFDERYFMYYEDVDLCRACWVNGYPVYYLPDVCVYHRYAKESAEGKGGTFQKIVKNPQTRAHISSWIKYTYKWFKKGY